MTKTNQYKECPTRFDHCRDFFFLKKKKEKKKGKVLGMARVLPQLVMARVLSQLVMARVLPKLVIVCTVLME